MAVIPCPKCGRVTPIRHNECVYCTASLKGAKTMAESSPAPEPKAAPPKSKVRKGKAPGHEEPRLLGSGNARFQPQSSDQVHVLVVSTGEPIELSAGKLFVMGRDPRASLVVRLPEVSRQHAEIDWDDNDPPRPLLNEIRSRNGTFLNGSRVQAGDPRPLRSGDEVGLGGAFRAQYLCVTPRELRIHVQERGNDETRSFHLDAPAPAAGGGAPADEGVLGDLVAAALGEADISELDNEGDFSRQHGKHLVKRLYTERQTGVLTVYDGTDVGEMILIEGRCRHAILGMLTGRDALEYVARLNRGRYRFRPEPIDDLIDSTQPTEVDENGLALSGDLSNTSGAELVKDLVSRRVTGVLTVFDASGSGMAVLHDGICQEAVFGKQRDREALDGIVRLRRGVYRFRPSDVASLPPTRGTEDYGYDDDYDDYDDYGYDYEEPRTERRAPPPPPSRTGALHRTGAMRKPPPLRDADDENGVLRRSTTPVRAPRPPGPPASRTSSMRRKRPPPPPAQRGRRRPPPPQR